MTIQEALTWATVQLKNSGVESSALDAEIILVNSAIRANRRIDRSWLYAHLEYKLTTGEDRKFRNFVRRRARREPVAYIVGHKEFYGLEFLVNRQVMVPRPESEALVELALDEIRNWKLDIRNWVVVDVGTGSGCIITALAKQFSITPQNVRSDILWCPRFFATDISKEAVAVARANAQRHGVAKRITFLRGNLLKPLKNVILNGTQWSEGSHTVHGGKRTIWQGVRFLANARNDKGVGLIVVANLPYLSTSEWRACAPEIKNWEPRKALDGGRDGLRYYRELFRQLHIFVIPAKAGIHGSPIRSGMTIVCELCPHQIPAFKTLVRRYFPRAIVEARQHIAVVRIN